MSSSGIITQSINMATPKGEASGRPSYSWRYRKVPFADFNAIAGVFPVDYELPINKVDNYLQVFETTPATADQFLKINLGSDKSGRQGRVLYVENTMLDATGKGVEVGIWVAGRPWAYAGQSTANGEIIETRSELALMVEVGAGAFDLLAHQKSEKAFFNPTAIYITKVADSADAAFGAVKFFTI